MDASFWHEKTRRTPAVGITATAEVSTKGNDMFNRLRTAGVLATTVGVVLVVPGVAQADPLTPGSETFELMCDGETHEVVVSGNGLFTPAHDVDSNTVFVPTMFGDTDVTVAIADTGEVLDQFTDPAVSKGNASRERRTSTSCTYTIVFEFHDEELDEHLRITAAGSVEGFYTPARR